MPGSLHDPAPYQPINPMGNLQQRLIWCTKGQNCGICNSLEGRVYTYDQWMSSGVWPGFHVNCDCHLRMVGATYTLSDPDFFGTDLNLLSDTINPLFFTFRFHWDPNYVPYSWYMTNQIMEAHLQMGKELSIGEVLKRMKTQFVGFFKRSQIFDNFFKWRTFRTLQHFQNMDGSATGGFPALFNPAIKKSYGRYFKKTIPFSNAALKPDSLHAKYPYQSNYTEGWAR